MFPERMLGSKLGSRKGPPLGTHISGNIRQALPKGVSEWVSFWIPPKGLGQVIFDNSLALAHVSHEQIPHGTLFWEALPGACLNNFEIGWPERGPQMEPFLIHIWSQKGL